MDIPASYIVSGDVIILPSDGCVMACDAVLLTGSCIVIESMLTVKMISVLCCVDL